MHLYTLNNLLSDEIEFEGKKYKFNGIQIPMIQRDYAQGRESEQGIRKKFIGAIFKALETSKPLELDFVYGSKKTIDKKELFIPLDGQQRLTTLFLLNWYIGNRELDGDTLEELRSTLAKFSYATRATSDLFCERLTKSMLSFSVAPSEEIKNAAWFFESFNLDPTVKSMLAMLDSIHATYGRERKEFYGNLTQIKFYVLPLDGFDLTDELYIKMNARGKQLTHFENFKADLIKWMKDEENPFANEFKQEVDYDGRSVRFSLFFELRLDNRWTNLFWQVTKKNEKPENRTVDASFLQFWNRYLLNNLILFSGFSQEEIENNTTFKELYGSQGVDSGFKYNNFDIYKTWLEKNKVIKEIGKVLEGLSGNFDEINEDIRPAWDKSDKWNMFSDNINQRQRILFFAVTRYLVANNFDSMKFKNWIRVVWNIIVDPDIRSVQAMVRTILFINKLSVHSEDIYAFLKKPDSLSIHKDSYYFEQIKEEHHKAILISKSEDWESLLIESESHPLFQGQIRFLLTENESTDIELFKQNKAAAFKLFQNNDLTDKPENFLWVRALLAKSSKIALPITLGNGRFSHWRDLINGPLVEGMRLLIDEIKASTDTLEKCLEGICKSYQRDNSQIWVHPLVNWVGANKETLLGNYSTSRKVMNYNYYGMEIEQVYLYNHDKWTDKNVMISNYRNEIIAGIINHSPNIQCWHGVNSQNRYFKGYYVFLYRTVNDIKFTYLFTGNFLKIGIWTSPELIDFYKNFEFDAKEKEFQWICRKNYPISNVNLDGIQPFIQKIESEVFDLENEVSLISKIMKQWPTNTLKTT